MQILFLANRFPYPPYRGDKLKIYNLAKRLSKNHSLHLVTFLQNKKDLKHLPQLEKIFDSIELVNLSKTNSILNCIKGIFSNLPFQVLYFKSKEMHKALNQIMDSKPELEVVHIQHLRMAQYYKDLTRPAILDLPDAFSLYWERRLKTKRVWWQRFFDNIESKRVNKYEQNITKYPKCLVCSAEDKTHLEKIHQATNVSLLENGVDMETFGTLSHDYSHNHKILFTGNMDYAPNVDGVIYFVEEILPSIITKHPSVQFVIAGQRPVKQVLELASANIRVTGFIEDLAAEYNSASVVVAPLRFGAGTQNKVLEAMASGIPVVCSEIGFGGLGIKSGEGAIKRTNATEFAQAVIELLDSQELRIEVGKKGKKVILDNFDWDSISLKLEMYLKSLCN